jgi:hypothetical protein
MQFRIYFPGITLLLDIWKHNEVKAKANVGKNGAHSRLRFFFSGLLGSLL